MTTRRPARPDRAADLLKLLGEDLDFHGPPERSARHGWHPFPAKFPPALPHRFVEALTVPGDTVLDPMAGSGTSLVEAQRLGRRAVGCDIDPLARRIALAKLTPLDLPAALAAGRAVLDEAHTRLRTGRDALEAGLTDRFDHESRQFVDYWFPPAQQLELHALAHGIARIPQEAVRRFLEVVLSSTIITKSGGVSLARDLAHTRPHRVLDKKPKSAVAEFARRLDRSLGAEPPLRHRLPVGRGAPDAAMRRSAEMRSASAAATGLSVRSVDLVVTSPPYANGAIDYMRAHKFSLVWLGWSLSELTALRREYLGHDAVLGGANSPLPDSCRTTLEALGRLDRRKAAVLGRYFSEMLAVMREMRRVLRPGGAAVVVIGSSVLRGLDVRTHEALGALGEAAGLRLVGIGRRRLDRDRRMLPARTGLPGKGIEQRMHEEFVVGFANAGSHG